MSDLWYLVIVAALGAGTFLGLWLSEFVLRREWNRLAQARKSVNAGHVELDRRWEEWRQLQDAIHRSRDPRE
ncbi:MAG: hypothetical protein ACRDQU_17645 [Pseudonocardiaceae bacterium]